jgi:hypothetical protein
VATGAPTRDIREHVAILARSRRRSPRFAITIVHVPLDTTVKASRSRVEQEA